jgi:hypothetical protein
MWTMFVPGVRLGRHGPAVRDVSPRPVRSWGAREPSWGDVATVRITFGAIKLWIGRHLAPPAAWHAGCQALRHGDGAGGRRVTLVVPFAVARALEVRGATHRGDAALAGSA